MRNYIRPVVYRILVSAMVLVLAGCASMIAPQPPEPPTPQAVRDESSQLYALEHGTQLSGQITATDVASAGYALVDTQCSVFFSAVYKWTNDTGFDRKEITLAGAAAAGVLAAVKASAKAIAVTAIAISLAAESFDNFQNFALFTPKPTAVGKLVSDAMAAYKQSAPPDDATIMISVPTAYSYISGYADLCTYHRIQDFVEQAVAKATAIDANAGTSSMFSGEDQVQLAGVNAALGLSPALLSDAKYAELYWYLKSAYINDANREKILNEFSTIKDNLWDAGTKMLPKEAQVASRILTQIAANNALLAKAEKALEDSNKPATTAGGAAAAPSTRIIVPPISARARGLPKIEIR
jgi:hypothetical protein